LKPTHIAPIEQLLQAWLCQTPSQAQWWFAWQKNPLSTYSFAGSIFTAQKDQSNTGGFSEYSAGLSTDAGGTASSSTNVLSGALDGDEGTLRRDLEAGNVIAVPTSGRCP
jgi:hypothetical protein